METNPEEASTSLCNLLCDEDKSCLNEDELIKVGSDTQFLNSQLVPYYHDSVNDDDYIQMLVEKERNLASNPSVSSLDYPPFLKNYRINAINWILNTQKSFGFQNHTAYLSVLYLDRFLSSRYIAEDQAWSVGLVAVGCISVAAKLEEGKAHPLSAYKVNNYTYATSMIQLAEIAVLGCMEWRMSLITPFFYFNYFIKELCDQESKQDDLIARGTELVMAIIKESKTMIRYRPFVVAAAAIVAAIDWQLTREELKLKLSTVSLWESSNNQLKQQEEEQLVSLYGIMQRKCATSVKNPPGTPNTTEVYQSATRRLVGVKRSLTFRDSDQNPDLPDDEDRG